MNRREAIANKIARGILWGYVAMAAVTVIGFVTIFAVAAFS